MTEDPRTKRQRLKLQTMSVKEQYKYLQEWASMYHEGLFFDDALCFYELLEHRRNKRRRRLNRFRKKKKGVRQ